MRRIVLFLYAFYSFSQTVYPKQGATVVAFLLFIATAMIIKDLALSQLKPYDNNPRRNDDAVEMVANSIREFGFKVPIVIDRDNVIVTGHTRAKAAEQLGLKTVPCIIADDLTPEQIKAFRLADNKVAELAEWDYTKLDEELADLEIDMTDFGFEFDDVPYESVRNDGNQRFRTDGAYNLAFNDKERVSGWFEMPTIKATQFIPSDLIGFNFVKSTKKRDAGVHFYLDDYQFERIWADPTQYITAIAEFECMLTPNFSLYIDMPMAMKIWNTYRSRLVGQIAQDYGLDVIPTVCWAEPETFKFAFDGIEPGGVVSCSTIGVKESAEALQIFRNGYAEMIKRLKPSAVLLYGGRIKDLDDGGVKIIEYANHITENMKGNKEDGR